MYGRFVGLDIGKKDARISLIKRGLRDVQLLQTIRTDLAVSSQEDSETLSRIFSDYSLPKGDIAVSLSDDPISVRVIRFPFADSKKVDQVYTYELENISTFDPDEKIHSYHMVKSEAGSEALVCVYEKEEVGELLDSFNKRGIDPKVLTYAPVALGALNDVLEGQRPLILVDIGESEISFSLFDENGIKRVRSSAKAADSLVANLSGALGVAEDELNFTREGLASLGGDDIERCLLPVIAELKKTIHFFETELKESVNSIVVSGALANIQGICDVFKKEFKRDVRKIFIPDLGVDNSPLYAKSYALALYGSSYKSGYLNFRKDEYKYVGVDRELRRVFLTPAILAAVFVAILIYNSASRYFELKGQAKELEGRISAVVKETFPDVKIIPRPVEYMESEVGKVKEKLRMIEGVKGPSTPLEVLRNISVTLPSSMQLVVSDIKFESGNTIKLQGVCDSYQEVTEIEDALSKSDMFESVTRNQTGNTVGGKTKFELALVLKPEV